MDYLLGTTKFSQESLEKAIEMMQKAIALDEDHAGAHAALGMLYCYTREYDKAIAEGERSITLNPSGANQYALYASTLSYAGRPEEAIPWLKKANRLNPFAPAWYFSILGLAYRSTGRFEEAASAYKKALQLSPDHIFAHIGLTATYSMIGREKEALSETAEVLKLNPRFSLDNYARVISFYKDQSVIDNTIGALRKAGLR